MAFEWTYPDPLNPNQPSLIGGKLRNVIPTLAVYIKELQDAVNILLTNAGRTAFNWDFLSASPGDTLFRSHYSTLQNKLDEVLTLYGYISEVDILGRKWSSFTEIDEGKYKAGWQIIQDFRDVCDGLGRKETWEPSTIDEYINPGGNENTIIEGSLGNWFVKYSNGFSEQFYSTSVYTEKHTVIFGEENKRLLQEYLVNSYPSKSSSTINGLSVFGPSVTLNKNIAGDVDTKFEFDFYKFGYNDFISTRTFQVQGFPKTFYTNESRPALVIKCYYSGATGDYNWINIILADLTNLPPTSDGSGNVINLSSGLFTPIILNSFNYFPDNASTDAQRYLSFNVPGGDAGEPTVIRNAYWYDINTHSGQNISSKIGEKIPISSFNIYRIKIGIGLGMYYGDIAMSTLPQIRTEVDNLFFT